MADELGYHTAEEIAALPVFPETEETDGDGPFSSEGYVYFITEDGTDNFKIGLSGNPEQRRKSLQTGSAYALKMTIKKVSDMAACEKRLLEKMEEKFEPTGGGTEWFTGDVKKARRVFHDVSGRFK